MKTWNNFRDYSLTAISRVVFILIVLTGATQLTTVTRGTGWGGAGDNLKQFAVEICIERRERASACQMPPSRGRWLETSDTIKHNSRGVCTLYSPHWLEIWILNSRWHRQLVVRNLHSPCLQVLSVCLNKILMWITFLMPVHQISPLFLFTPKWFLKKILKYVCFNF